MTISATTVQNEFFLLNHSTLDGLLADLDLWRDSFLRFRKVKTRVFGSPWKFRKCGRITAANKRPELQLELLEQTASGRLLRTLRLRFMDDLGELWDDEGTALQVWAEISSSLPAAGGTADISQRRKLDENLRGAFS